MRCLNALALCAVFAALSSDTLQTAAAQQRPDDQAAVLLVTGGHDFDQDSLRDLFHSIPGVTISRAEYPAAAGMFTPQLADDYDAIVFYDMWTKPLSAEQQQGLLDLLNRGIGVVGLHHTLAAHPAWSEYAKIIGGRYHVQDRQADGRKVTRSSYHHDQEIKIHIAASEHPITQGLADFVVQDETYASWELDPQVEVLLTTEHPRSDRALAWVKTYGNSRICYVQPGHGPPAFENSHYRKLMARCVRWAAGLAADPAAEFTRLFNGRDLSGWRQAGNSSWEVQDGLLIGRQGPGGAPGDLFSENSYGDFELAVTYRIKWPANSGVWYRYQSPQRAYQADILEYKQPVAYSGTLYSPGKMFLAVNDDPSLVKRDGWNGLLIRVVENRHVIVFNGTQVADVRDESSKNGQIGFQIHAGDEFNNMEIRIKEVRIRQL